MGEMRDSDWSRENLLRSDWSIPKGASITTFRHQKPRFSESVSRVGFLKTEVFEYDDFIDHAVHGTCKRCHRISIVLVFTCGRAKAIQIRSMKTDISFRK